MNLNICLFPMKIEWGNEKLNLSNLENSLQHIHPATDLVIIPETFSTGFPVGMSSDEVKRISRPADSNIIDKLKDLSKRHGFAIAGSFVCSENDKLYNRAFFVEPSGEISFADKHHLFSMAGEDKLFTSGNNRLIVRFRGWNIALFICYDLRFPVWSRNIDNYYDLLLYVANWPEVRISAWEKLLPARAIENLSYVAGVDCKGTDPKGFDYNGSSHVFDFKGNEISVFISASENNSFVYASLSKEKLEKFREKFPAFRDADTFRMI